MKKKEQLFFLWNVTFFLVVLTVFPLVQTVKAAEIFVPADYTTIQAAIDASSTGDTVIVADGTYYENIHFPYPVENKNITLKSEKGPEFTIIDGGDSGTVVFFPGGSDSVLEGFTITNGLSEAEGGGILIASDTSPTITNCIITNNAASTGGGIAIGDSASPTITNCTITNNEASERGGGIMVAFSSTPFIDNCIISDNSAPFGGGISCADSSAPFITNSFFQKNSATGDTADDNGGGLHGAENSTPIIINCIFRDNTSERNGGALAFNTSQPLIVNCTFDNNTAALNGGAISLLESAPKITNCSFSNNSALTDPGGAIACNIPTSGTIVTNSIFWGDHPAEIACDADIISVSYSDIQGGPAWPANSDKMGATIWPGAGEGNINADPRFKDQLGGDFHLTNDSPCIDAGDNSDPDLQPTDFDGYDRKVDDPAVIDTGNGTPPNS